MGEVGAVARGEDRRVGAAQLGVDGDETLVKLLDDNGVKYQAAPPQACNGATLSLFILPLLLLMGFWFFMSQRDPRGGGVQAFSRSSATMVPEEGTGVTFDDVAGLDAGRGVIIPGFSAKLTYFASRYLPDWMMNAFVDRVVRSTLKQMETN